MAGGRAPAAAPFMPSGVTCGRGQRGGGEQRALQTHRPQWPAVRVKVRQPSMAVRGNFGLSMDGGACDLWPWRPPWPARRSWAGPPPMIIGSTFLLCQPP
ncbi:unnamed protein product [Urochloa humidicola]